MKNVRLRHALFSGACLLFVIWAYAGPKDFWEAKPYTDWTAKEVDRILRSDKSPWTRTLLPITASSYSIGSTDSGSGGGGGGMSKGGGGGGMSKGGGGGGGGGSAAGPSDEIIINWNSRPIREARARDAMLRRPDIAKAQLDAILNHKPESLELLVTGLSLGRGGRRGAAEADTTKGGTADADMAKFKEDTFLQKKNQQKIPLLDVVIPRGMGLPITLKFARETDGKPTLTPDDKEVMLQIRIGDKKYKYNFKLADMMVGDKLEI